MRAATRSSLLCSLKMILHFLETDLSAGEQSRCILMPNATVSSYEFFLLYNFAGFLVKRPHDNNSNAFVCVITRSIGTGNEKRFHNSTAEYFVELIVSGERCDMQKCEICMDIRIFGFYYSSFRSYRYLLNNFDICIRAIFYFTCMD